VVVGSSSSSSRRRGFLERVGGFHKREHAGVAVPFGGLPHTLDSRRIL
jgi:hypothetical protein